MALKRAKLTASVLGSPAIQSGCKENVCRIFSRPQQPIDTCYSVQIAIILRNLSTCPPFILSSWPQLPAPCRSPVIHGHVGLGPGDRGMNARARRACLECYAARFALPALRAL